LCLELIAEFSFSCPFVRINKKSTSWFTRKRPEPKVGKLVWTEIDIDSSLDRQDQQEINIK